MPYIVQHLIEGRSKPVTVTPDKLAQEALELMAEGGFSQLPVVDQNEKPVGMVTSESILRALNNFGVTLDALKVSHAMVKVVDYRADEDLFDMLDDLRDTGVVVIVDGQGKLTGIVTSYDTTDYFRRRSEDMMLVEDIEGNIKDHIRASCINGNGEVDETAINALIAETTSSKQDIRKKFQNALTHYLTLQNDGKRPDLNPSWLDEVFSRHFDSKESNKPFDDLTLYEYSQLLLHKSKVSHFSSIFNLDSKAIDKLLNEVRKSRNALAHFHGELSSKQRDQLRFCAEWLAHHPPRFPTINTAVVVTQETNGTEQIVTVPLEATLPTEVVTVNPEQEQEKEVIPVDEATNPDESRYALLAVWLQKRPRRQDKVELSFRNIEEIINDSLPRSAREHRNWWANDSVSHPQSQQWLEVGWRVSNVNIAAERVVFTRIIEREKGYIDFYSALLIDLRKEVKFPLKSASPDGLNWITIARLPDTGVPLGYLGFAFTRTKQFRAEFYIDAFDYTKNKLIFDSLYAIRDVIQKEMGENLPLTWERIDNKRACRIAVYTDTPISSEPEKLALLRRWGVLAMLRLQKVFSKRLQEVVKKHAELELATGN